jgi:peptidoglycan/LPS O-acetylase OafA/YrhL
MGERRYDLDWVRIVAFLLLIFYHVGMYYVTWDWHVSKRAPQGTQAGWVAGGQLRRLLAGARSLRGHGKDQSVRAD